MKKKNFLKSMTLNENVFAKSEIWNKFFFALSDFEKKIFASSAFKSTFLQRVRF